MGVIELTCEQKLYSAFLNQVYKSARLWKNKIKCLFPNPNDSDKSKSEQILLVPAPPDLGTPGIL